MKDETVEVLGLKFTIHGVPETVQEFNTLADRKDGVDACLFEACRNIKYRGVYPTIRSEFLDRVEAVTGIKRKTEVSKKADGTDGAEKYTESEEKYFKRVLATYQPEGAETAGVDKGYFQTLADEVSNAKATKKEGDSVITLDEFLVTFDPSASERTGSTKIAKVYLDAAKDFLAKPADWQRRAVSNLEKLNPGLKIETNEEDGTLKLESVAVGIKVNEDRKRKSSIDELGS